ncbi:T9SS type A sorting domain-containing protein [Carboxylicivirga taeanensis]|uniref:T9SS type A sorting domain-containing protein n=1 Tax=Carboxylicivirga taeanensis TaxID=1416875 RepID=UPI003F6DF73D
MKTFKLIITLWLLGHAAIQAQEYRMCVYNFIFFSDAEDGYCGGNYEFKVRYKGSNEYIQFFYKPLPKADISGWPPSKEDILKLWWQGKDTMSYKMFSFDKELESVYIYGKAEDNKRNDCKRTNTSTSEGYIYDIGRKCISGKYSNSGRNGGDWEVEHSINFDYVIHPVVNLVEPKTCNNIIGYLDEFTLSTTPESSNYDPSVYIWQYQVGSNSDAGWKNLNDKVKVNGKSSLTLLPSDFLDITDVGKSIFFRIELCEGFYSDNDISYELKMSAPHIVDNDVTQPLCYDTNDGTLTITLDRELEDGELLSMYFEDLSLHIDTDECGNEFYDLVDGVEQVDDLTKGDFKLDDNNKRVIYTFRGLPASSNKGFRVKMLFKGEKGMYYTDGEGHQPDFKVEKYTPVEFSHKAVPANCHGGYDGLIELNANGGVPAEKADAWYYFNLQTGQDNFSPIEKQVFSDGNRHVITDMPKGNYVIQVYDSNDCPARDKGGLGAIINTHVGISEPEAPLIVTETARKDPTAHGWHDGQLIFSVTGGTPWPDGTYYFELREGTTDGPKMEVFQTHINTNPQDFAITFYNLAAKEYYLTIKDANYEVAKDKVDREVPGIGTCGYISQPDTIEQPEPIKVTLAIANPIYCNDDNAINSEQDKDLNGVIDEFETGSIKADVSGGIRQTSDLPYQYNWEVKNKQSGVWEPVHQPDKIVLDSVIHTLQYGDYRLNVEDGNGVVWGDYQQVVNAEGIYSYELTNKIYAGHYLPEPPEFVVNLLASPASCANGSDGVLNAQTRGGTPFDNGEYEYTWSTSNGSGNRADNLPSGHYFVQVTDFFGCLAQSRASIEMPGSLGLDTLVLNSPTCFDGTDGQIQVLGTGGTPPYSYQWNTNSTSSSLSNLSAGSYVLVLSDASGCNAVNVLELQNPEPISILLPDTVTLCAGQEYLADIKIEDPHALYMWYYNGSEISLEPDPVLNKEGDYKVVVYNEKNCQATTSLRVNTSEEVITPEFVVSSQAFTGEEVVVLETSTPQPEMLTWLIPEGAQVVNEDGRALALMFDRAGTYPLVLNAIEGQCSASYSQPIIVSERSPFDDIGDASHPFIKRFVVSPNPSSSNFTIDIELQEASPAVVTIYSVGQQQIRRFPLSNSHIYEIRDAIHVPGVYIILLETPKANDVRKLIIG